MPIPIFATKIGQWPINLDPLPPLPKRPPVASVGTMKAKIPILATQTRPGAFPPPPGADAGVVNIVISQGQIILTTK